MVRTTVRLKAAPFDSLAEVQNYFGDKRKAWNCPAFGFPIITTPASDENAPLSFSAVYFPHLVDGAGFTTQLILSAIRRPFCVPLLRIRPPVRMSFCTNKTARR